MSTLRILCVVPFLDERRHLADFLKSLAAQTRRPDELLLVDDGSGDGSPQLADEFARDHPGVQVMHRPRRPVARDRLADAPELAAFQWALEQVAEPWDVVVKMDADLVLSPDVFDTLERAFIDQPDLGIAGTYLSVLDRTGQRRRERCRPDHVRGATKFYRRGCYEQIGPVPRVLGWDTIDEIAARRRGWRTSSIACPTGDTLHLRPTGGANGQLRAQFRWGQCAYGIGQHPIWVAISASRRLVGRPPLLASAAFAAGWLAALVGRAPRAPAEVRAFGRREHLDRLRLLLRRPGRAQYALRFRTKQTDGS